MADEAHRSQYANLAREHHGRAAERDADRVHGHAGGEGRPLHAAGVRRLRLDLPDAPGAGGPRDGPDLLRVAPDPASRSPTRSSSRTSRRCSRPRRRRPRASSVTAWAKLEKVVGAPDRLRDGSPTTSHQHFTAAARCSTGKAMVVAYSRRIAAELTGMLRERFGEEAVDVRDLRAGDRPAEPISRFRRSKAGAQAARQATSRTRSTRCASSWSRTCG